MWILWYDEVWCWKKMEFVTAAKIIFLVKFISFFIQFSMKTHCFVVNQDFVEISCPFSYQFDQFPGIFI